MIISRTTEEALIRQQSRPLIRVLTYISTYNNLETMIMKNKFKRIIITTGALLMMTMAPITQSNPLGQYLAEMTTITAHAAEQSQLSYSTRWETQADGSWKYRLNTGGYAVNRWVQDEVDHNWYLLDDNGVMRTGVYKSYDKYYLLSEVHDGHYGHLVKNGEVYNGITISASTNADDEGALTDSTLYALRGAGVNVDNVQDVSGTTHTTGGQDVGNTEASNNQTGNNGTEMQSDAEDDWWLEQALDMMGGGGHYGSLH